MSIRNPHIICCDAKISEDCRRVSTDMTVCEVCSKPFEVMSCKECDSLYSGSYGLNCSCDNSDNDLVPYCGDCELKFEKIERVVEWVCPKCHAVHQDSDMIESSLSISDADVGR